MQKTIALLDGDIFIYKVAFAAMKEIMFDEYVISVGDSAEAKVALDNWIDKVVTDVGADRMQIAFTSHTNFRKEINPEYKAHRTKPAPYLVKELRQYCYKVYDTIAQEGLEADDILGKIVSESYLNPCGDRVIGISEDKDLRTVPGAHFNPRHSTIPETINILDATKAFFTQVLVGDPADNYKGCPGIGAVKAASYIERAEKEATFAGEGSGPLTYVDYYEFVNEAWEAIVKCYEKAGHEQHDAITNATMAKILWYNEEPKAFNIKVLTDYWRLANVKRKWNCFL